MSTSNEAFLIIDKALEGKNFEQALQFCRARISKFPDDPYGPFWLGVSLVSDRRYAEAIVAFRRALNLDPNHYNSIAYLLYAKSCLCDWEENDELKEKLLTATDEDFTIGHLRYVNPNLLFGIVDDYEFHKKLAMSRASYYFSTRPTWKINGYVAPNKNIIKIGYISPHFNSSSFGILIRNLFSFHDREKFLIYCYSIAPSEGQIADEIIASADFHQDFSGITDFEAAKRIHKDGIHILVDLCGYLPGARNRIMAMKPAPIICSILGSYFTIGAKYIKYLITSNTVINEEDKDNFTEKVFYLPTIPFATEPFTCNIKKNSEAKEKEGLLGDAFVFCCFCKPEYISKETFSLWIEILAETPDSILWLSSDNTLQLEQNLHNYAKDVGIEPKRIVFTHSNSSLESWKHGLADAWLAPLSFNSHQEILLSFWINLPVVTLQGKTSQAKTAGAYYESLGLPEYIAEDKKSYKQMAINLCNNVDKYQEIKQKIKEKVIDSDLYNPGKFIHDLEDIYGKIWEDYLGR